MNSNGQYVTAIPASERFREQVASRVTGTLERTDVDFGNSGWTLYQVHVTYPDGTDIPIDVQESTIRPANRRRAKTTEIPFPDTVEEDDVDQ